MSRTVALKNVAGHTCFEATCDKHANKLYSSKEHVDIDTLLSIRW